MECSQQQINKAAKMTSKALSVSDIGSDDDRDDDDDVGAATHQMNVRE